MAALLLAAFGVAGRMDYEDRTRQVPTGSAGMAATRSGDGLG